MQSMLPQRLEMIAVESETIQDRFQFPNEICFIGQADLVTNFRGHGVTGTTKIRNHGYSARPQRLEDNGSNDGVAKDEDALLRELRDYTHRRICLQVCHSNVKGSPSRSAAAIQQYPHRTTCCSANVGNNVIAVWCASR